LHRAPVFTPAWRRHRNAPGFGKTLGGWGATAASPIPSFHTRFSQRFGSQGNPPSNPFGDFSNPPAPPFQHAHNAKVPFSFPFSNGSRITTTASPQRSPKFLRDTDSTLLRPFPRPSATTFLRDFATSENARKASGTTSDPLDSAPAFFATFDSHTRLERGWPCAPRLYRTCPPCLSQRRRP